APYQPAQAPSEPRVGSIDDLPGLDAEPQIVDDATALSVDEPDPIPDASGEWVGKPRIKKAAPVVAAEPEPAGIAPDLVTLFVTPKQGVFKGVDLRNALVSMGLSLGDRDLYHRHSGSGRDVLYSVANATPEGVFPQGAMEGFTSPGVILLMELRGHGDPEHGFEEMVSSARQMSRRLKAEVLDSHQHPLQLEFINDAKAQVKAYAKAMRQGGVAN
ncbi:MAG: cell division protein ZipA C-terminal FtsZ-binding domain-containing protein, partial [Litorivicinus sp.]